MPPSHFIRDDICEEELGGERSMALDLLSDLLKASDVDPAEIFINFPGQLV